MMEAIEIIAEEHRAVWRLLRCLKAMVDRAEEAAPDPAVATEVLFLFQWFVEQNHQDKEELCLFPCLLERSAPAETRRLQHMFEDHSRERRRLMGMRLHVEGACLGRLPGLDRFAAHARSYLRLQRDHLAEEEMFVLPLAHAILSPEDDRRIVRGFQQVEARGRNLGNVDARLEALGRRFGVEAPASDVPLHLVAWT